MAITPARSSQKFTSSDKERQLTEALMLSDPVTDLNIAAEIDYFRLARDRYFVPISVKIPGSELVLAKKGGAEKPSIDFVGQITDAKTGKTVQNVRDIADIKLTGQTAADLSKHPIAYDPGYVLPPGTYKMKILARENETGKMGTFRAHIHRPRSDYATDRAAHQFGNLEQPAYGSERRRFQCGEG